MAWYVVVLCGMAWYDVVWYGMVWHGSVWHGMVWYGPVVTASDCKVKLMGLLAWEVSTLTDMLRAGSVEERGGFSDAWSLVGPAPDAQWVTRYNCN